jgi:hypothetical protein
MVPDHGNLSQGLQLKKGLIWNESIEEAILTAKLWLRDNEDLVPCCATYCLVLLLEVKNGKKECF